MSERKEIVQKLLHSLRHCDMDKPVAQRMTYKTLPWTTTNTFLGHALQPLLVPKVEGDIKELQSVFDTWCYPLVEGDSTPEAAMREAGYEDLLHFLSRHSETVAEAAVMLLFILGVAADCNYSDKSILVSSGDTSFGIVDGVVRSRFCDGLQIGDVNPQTVLETCRDVRVFDPTFIALYREAYNIGDATLSALIALRTGSPDFDFARAFDKVKPRRLPTQKDIDRWEKKIGKAKIDPVATIYNMVVPKWMTAREFEHHVSKLEGRSLSPDIDRRMVISNRLVSFFHKKKKENK